MTHYISTVLKLANCTLIYDSLNLQSASGLFQELDDRINYVATKVVHLGDQLEGINTPRSRAIEAQELMKYFDEFAKGKLVSSVFNDQFQVT